MVGMRSSWGKQVTAMATEGASMTTTSSGTDSSSPKANSSPARIKPGTDNDVRDRIGREVQRRVGPRRWDMWFDRTTDFQVDGSHLRIEADSRFVADWIERHSVPVFFFFDCDEILFELFNKLFSFF